MNKNPFFNSLGAAGYIVVIVLVINKLTSLFPGADDSIIVPMIMLGLFVLSAAVMGYLFLAEPLRLYLDNKKDEAFSAFFKTVGYFACFVVVFILLLVTKTFAN